MTSSRWRDSPHAVEGYLGVCFVRWTRAIGPRLKKVWRKTRGLDQLRAARRIGVCLETVTKLERARLDHGCPWRVRGRVFDVIAEDARVAASTVAPAP